MRPAAKFLKNICVSHVNPQRGQFRLFLGDKATISPRNQVHTARRGESISMTNERSARAGGVNGQVFLRRRALYCVGKSNDEFVIH
jgi:hypothetical protein